MRHSIKVGSIRAPKTFIIRKDEMKKLIQILLFCVLLISTSNANDCKVAQSEVTKAVSNYNNGSNSELSMVLFQQNVLIKCQQKLMMKLLSDLHTKVDASIDLNSNIETTVTKIKNTTSKNSKDKPNTKTNSFGTGY